MAKFRLRDFLFVMVDIADYRRMQRARRCWYAMHYPHRPACVVGEKIVKGVRFRIRLPRFVMEAPPGARVYHRNGNHLDCRRRNLVVVNCRSKTDEHMPVLRPGDSGEADGRPPAAPQGAVL